MTEKTIQKPDGKIEIRWQGGYPASSTSEFTLVYWRTKGHPWTRTTHTFNGLRTTAIGCETVAEFVAAMEKTT